MSAFECDDCGRTIGQRDSHVVLRDQRVVCMKHYVRHLDDRQVATVLNRQEAIDRLHPSIRRPRGPEMR